MNFKTLILLSTLVGMFFSCKTTTKEEKTLKGYIIWQKDYITFTNCETQKTYWVADKTGELEKNYKSVSTGEGYSEVYFELQGDLLPPSTTGVAANFDNIIAVTKIVRFSKTAPENACIGNTNKPVLGCYGNFPEWSFGFSGTDVRFKADYPNDTTVYFPKVDVEQRDSAGVGKIYYAYIGNENFQHIEMIVMKKNCKTTKKTSPITQFTALVKFGGIEYHGCAKISFIDEKNDKEYSSD